MLVQSQQLGSKHGQATLIFLKGYWAHLSQEHWILGLNKTVMLLILYACNKYFNHVNKNVAGFVARQSNMVITVFLIVNTTGEHK